MKNKIMVVLLIITFIVQGLIITSKKEDGKEEIKAYKREEKSQSVLEIYDILKRRGIDIMNVDGDDKVVAKIFISGNLENIKKEINKIKDFSIEGYNVEKKDENYLIRLEVSKNKS